MTHYIVYMIANLFTSYCKQIDANPQELEPSQVEDLMRRAYVQGFADGIKRLESRLDNAIIAVKDELEIDE